MILVTGATGTIGRLTLARLPAHQPVRVLARKPERVAGLRPGVEVTQGDFGDEASLARALSGVRRALLITVDVTGEHDARFLHAARAAGVQHVVKITAAAVLDGLANDAITQWQRTAEHLLRTSGLAWTLLRPRSYMSNTLAWASTIRSEGLVRTLYGASANACVDPRDVADAAVRALTEDGHEAKAYTLTGPQPVSAAQQVEQLGGVLGRRLSLAELTVTQARAAWLRRYPEPVAEALLHSAGRQYCGAKVGVDPALEKLTGHPARPFSVWAADHAAYFAGS